MNIFKNIFGRIWALWGLVSFFTTFLIIFLPSMLSHLMKEPAGQKYFIGVSKVWMSFWLFLIGCPVKVSGKEHFKKGSAYIVIYNHNAFLDVPLSAPFVPGPNKTIAKASFVKIPIFGQFYKRGSVLVDRKDDRSRGKSFDKMKKVLQAGMHMCIYPEGTRNRSALPIKPFFDGAFKLSAATGNEIIPCIIFGTKKAMPINKKFYLMPTRLHMQFLPSVSPVGKTVTEFKEQVYNEMLAVYTAGYKS